MALRLVYIKHPAHLAVKLWIKLAKPLGDVHMYCGFAYSELFCRGAHRGLVFDDILAQVDGSFLNDAFQKMTSLADVSLIVCRKEDEYDCFCLPM